MFFFNFTDLPLKCKEEEFVDRIKKCLNNNIVNLQKTNKTLDLGEENLKFWSENLMRKHISKKRMIDGKSYNDYEAIYKENIALNI
jgi:hypothetical protein